MHKVVKLLFITILTFTIGCNAETKKRAPYIKYVHKIARIFAKEMKNQPL